MHHHHLAPQDLSMSAYRRAHAYNLLKENQEVCVTSNSSCTLPATYPPHLPASQAHGHHTAAALPNTLPSGKHSAAHKPGQMDLAECSKSIARLLQHSILQLCNEHVGYSHKLQILGVLCMTVDDEQQELVVKVNNTLKRVNPPQTPVRDSGASPQILTPAATPTALSSMMGFGGKLGHSLYNGLANGEEAGTASPSRLSPHQSADSREKRIPSSGTPGRKSHSRKGAKPVKVEHVIDEGDIFSSDDEQDIMTVIPTDPDGMYDVPAGKAQSLDKQKVALYRSNPGAMGKSISAVRALLLGRASAMPQDLTTSRGCDADRASPRRGLTLPVFVAPRHYEASMSGRHGDSPVNINLGSTSVDHRGLSSPSALDRELQINEESEDYTAYNNPSPCSIDMDTSTRDSAPEDLSQHIASISAYGQVNGLNSMSLDGLPAQAPYSLGYPSASTPNKSMDGLSIQYTPNGPITVASNGKNVSQQSRGTKVKDIILYDDSSPLHEQRGNRIETDYMLDSFGMEGRKRRRRNADETLTSEEIAEYLGSMDLAPHLFKCEYCSDELRDLTQYLQHTLTMHHCYICHQCGKSFTTKSSLLRHRPIHTGMRRFACSICKKTFYRKDKCKAHIKRHLGESNVKPEVESCDQIGIVA